MAQWVGHPASMAFLMPGEVWDRAKCKGKLKLKMAYKTSWTGKTVRLIPTKFKGKETTYYDLCHEGNILKILILCILFTSSFKLCFIAATLPLMKEVERVPLQEGESNGVCVGRDRRRGSSTRMKRKIKICPSNPQWIVGSIKAQREGRNDGTCMPWIVSLSQSFWELIVAA